MSFEESLVGKLAGALRAFERAPNDERAAAIGDVFRGQVVEDECAMAAMREAGLELGDLAGIAMRLVRCGDTSLALRWAELCRQLFGDEGAVELLRRAGVASRGVGRPAGRGRAGRVGDRRPQA